MLINDAKKGTPKQKYNVTVNGVTTKKNVLKSIAEDYIKTLNEDLQSKATIIPVTEDGLEILFE